VEIAIQEKKSFLFAHSVADAGEINFKAVQICKLIVFEFVFAYSNKMISSLQNFFARHLLN